MAASRELISALGEIFRDQRFDEYGVLNHAGELPLEFLNSRRQRQRVCIAHWLRWAADQKIGLSRHPDNPTWFRIAGPSPYTPVAGNRRARFNTN
jgi:hypothetical protein